MQANRSADAVTYALDTINKNSGTVFISLAEVLCGDGKGGSIAVFKPSNTLGQGFGIEVSNDSNGYDLTIRSRSAPSYTTYTANILLNVSSLDGLKIAYTYSNNGVHVFINGTKYITSIGNNWKEAMANASNFRITGASTSTVSYGISAKIHDLKIYPRALSDAEAVALTS